MNKPSASDAAHAQGTAFVRGQYLPIADAAIPITDWGFLRSDATYDVVTVWDGAFFSARRASGALSRQLRALSA